jgi:hypothetical protein
MSPEPWLAEFSDWAVLSRAFGTALTVLAPKIAATPASPAFSANFRREIPCCFLSSRFF